jgi:hypothetical protein
MQMRRPTRLLSLLAFLPVSSLFAQSGPPVTETGTPLPAYRAFFRHVQFLRTSAQRASAPDAAELSGWYQKHIGLTAAEDAQLKQIAVKHIAAIEAIEKQVGQIIQAQRAQFPGGTLPSAKSLPQPSALLLQLQQQRDDATVANVRSLQSALSAGSFTKLDTWVRATFKNQQKGVAPAGLHAPSALPQQVK